jgi:hypothetical protein
MEQTKENTTFVINKTEKPSSYEFGKAGNRFKLYFDTAEDLFNQIKQLKEKGLYQDEPI